MGKLLMLAIIVAIIYFLILPRWRIKDKKDDKNVDSFVECEKCGTYIDVKNAIISNSRYICEDCIKEK
ncbi:hypothetical protein CBLAS_0419 [Campylobacter blaseri]|uniref:Prokaryotic metallothionein family protein n=1 Tax=Campylobacter blaseri TaxID=2042961 RepID=A0A2P8R0M4_9BACT|nr:PP0621 family protein [Campylobacter blaseri]PSM52041.1 hypothetical protein CQ405_05640 [Campylobacter blaseri]PSM53826.1 hypothetical protein CRN67_05640 [Campylobacter blaseri]QKF85622.1 hypothetical protein CBLAS_0419 [Campylobacter blaseri]